MASLNLDGDYGGFYWDIDGLGNPFNTTYYQAAALAAAYQGDGISSLTYVERRAANPGRTQYYTPTYWRSASPGTYTYYGYAQAANGLYYYCGAASVVVYEEEYTYWVQIRAYDADTDSTIPNAVWTYGAWDSDSITLNECVSGAPSSLTNAYDYDSVRNYSSWITFRGSTFSGLSSSSENYINLYYSSKTKTYYYRIRYLLPDGTTLSTGSTRSAQSTSGYITVATSGISAPSGYQKTGSYTAISGCSYSGSGGYFSVTATSSGSPAILGVYVQEDTYELDVYDYYNGTSHYRDSYDLAAGYSFNASVYASPPYGYEYDHAESPRGTRVTSVTMNADRSLYLFYTPIEPTTPSATITVTGRTENSLTVRANITNSLTYSDAWYLCISTTPGFSTYQSVRGSGSSVTNTFTGLAANTTYYFRVVNVYNEQQAWQSGYTTGTTRRAAFAWDYNDNLDNRRPTANEWSRLVSFIEAVAGVTVSAAAKATLYVGGTLSHILFNELAQDVGLAHTVSKGMRVFKSVLNALKDKANILR